MYRQCQLFDAIRSNDIQLIQSLLARKCTRWSCNGTDFHLLRKSIKYDRKEITELLLDHGCRVNLPFFIGDSPLHLAVAKPLSNYLLVKRLLERGANVSHLNQCTETPIHVAFASRADDEVMTLLLEAYLKKSRLNETNDVGLSYLHIACATADLDLVRKFVEGGADINARVNEECNSPNAGNTPLHMAVKFSKMEVIEYLLEQGADVYTTDNEGSTAIHLALFVGETDIIELLFEYDHDRSNLCNVHGMSHFMAACACRGPDIAKEFLTNMFDGEQSWNMTKTVDSPENPDYTLKGFTPLHFTAMFGRLEMTEILLNNGASCSFVTSDNITPLQLADGIGHKQVANLIKAHCHEYNYSD